MKENVSGCFFLNTVYNNQLQIALKERMFQSAIEYKYNTDISFSRNNQQYLTSDQTIRWQKYEASAVEESSGQQIPLTSCRNLITTKPSSAAWQNQFR